ncbi:hypothetical protein L198_01282 [Cryptococcus wingfieldii CBS 7118]|uniref:C2H2-type domain-containing protein n=1 Tax=Cryptococcus wingfieldii CBS 7118 TaxID=1295528 RepID=A0A1E3JZ03_9TREE|nr:hypothetical protein L198_01282 [Cryptococcus wingfieldii CBS 7118]ODO06053.1 hypothetical protein L198_01282 [Cryptococcus wingfieldii CBS 7118]
MSTSENSSPTDFAFEPPALPSAGHPFVSPGTYKADPLRQASYDPSLPTGSFTPAAANPPVGGYFGDTSYQPQPGFGQGQGQGQYGALNSAQSSFSSASGSAAGGSFSSVDLPGPSLPGISKEFSRPSLADTRRPATASAIQTRGQYGDYMIGGGEDPRRLSQRHVQHLSPNEKDEDDEGDSSDTENVSPETVYMPSNNRRASEPHFNLPGNGQNWNQFPPSASHDASGGAFGLPSAPAHVSPMGYLQQQQQQTTHLPPSHFSRPSFSNRPQTSDGLPSYTNTVTLPPASSIARHVPGGGNDSPFFHHPPGIPPPGARGYEGTFPGNKSFAFDGQIRPPVPPAIPGGIRPSYIPPHPHPMLKSDLAPSDQMGYMSLSSGVLPPTSLPSAGGGGGSSGSGQPRKRPRRRYEEIERLYHCGWNGCEKSYGTLNHLNAHVMMQKHGEKRLPSEFKEMRKAWRKKKRDSATATANANYLTQASAWQANQSRLSLSANSSSGESDWDRRDSTSSAFSVGSERAGSFAAQGGMGMPLMGGVPGAGYAGGGGWGVPGVPAGVMQGVPMQGMMQMGPGFGNGVMMDSRPSTAGSMSSAMSVEPGRYAPTPPGSAHGHPLPHPHHQHPHHPHPGHPGVQPTFFVNPPPPQSLPSLSASSTASTPGPTSASASASTSGPGAGAGAIGNRRPSAPNHLLLPDHNLLDGFRVTEDHSTPTAGNPFPAGAGSAPGTRPSSSHGQGQQQQGQQQQQGGEGQGQGQGQGGQGKGFATLNSPVNGSADYGQFAFQR